MEAHSMKVPQAAPDPVGAYPAAIADMIAVLRDEPKDAPEEFIGRARETRTIMRAIHGSIPTKRRETLDPTDVSHQPAVLQMITGGPGAGKTSLLKAIEARCRHHNCRVIRLRDEELENPETLTNAIRKKCHWWGRDTLTTLGRELANTTAAATDAVGGGWVRRLVRVLGGGKVEPGSDLEADSIRPARAVLECWQRDAPADPTDVLRLLSTLGPTIITIDEAHQLDPYLNTDRTATARTVIRTLATPEARHEAGVKNCVMVVAGLNDLHPTITELGTFRQMPLQLGAFCEADVRTVLEHWIDRAHAPAEATERAKAAWVPILATGFGQWPHHTVGAGMGACTILQVDSTGATTNEWGIRAVCEIAENYRKRLYGYVSTMAQQEDNPLEVVLAVAHAMQQVHGTANAEEIQLLTARVLEEHRQELAAAQPTADKPASIPDFERSVQLLLRTGILEYADIDGTATMPSRLRISVPSLGDHLRGLPMRTEGPATKALRETTLTPATVPTLDGLGDPDNKPPGNPDSDKSD